MWVLQLLSCRTGASSQHKKAKPSPVFANHMAPGAGKVPPNPSRWILQQARGLAAPSARGPGSPRSAKGHLLIFALLCAFRARIRFLKIKLCRIVWVLLFGFFSLLLKAPYITAGAGVGLGLVFLNSVSNILFKKFIYF